MTCILGWRNPTEPRYKKGPFPIYSWLTHRLRLGFDDEVAGCAAPRMEG